MRVFGLFLCAIGLGAFSCVPEEDDPLPFDNARGAGLACVPGEQRACACPGDASGVQVCDGDGQRLLPCDCGGPSGSCTLFPDCRGCTRCFDTCICHSRGDVAGCSLTCGLDDAGPDAAFEGGNQCGAEQCQAPRGAVPQCCTEQGKCGVVLAILGPGCLELNQPGTVDPRCPSLDVPGFSLPGCCRSDGRCGVLDQFLPLGCLAREQFDPDGGASCIPNAE